MRPNHMRIARAAAKALKTLDKHKAPIPIENIIENFGIKRTSSFCEAGIAGYLHIDENDASVMGINCKYRKTRQRFAMAHGFGHYMLHREPRSLFVDKSFSIVNSRRGVVDVKDIEANLFASEILMPAELVYVDLEGRNGKKVVAESLCSFIAKKYNVSKSVAGFRLANLGVIL